MSIFKFMEMQRMDTGHFGIYKRYIVGFSINGSQSRTLGHQSVFADSEKWDG